MNDPRQRVTVVKKGQDVTVWDYLCSGLFFTLYGIVKYLPTPIGNWLRFLVLKVFVKRVESARVKEGVTIYFPNRVSIGKHVTLNEWVLIDGYAGVTIGDGCRIAHRVTILSEDHVYDDPHKAIYEQGRKIGSVDIGSDVWVGAGAIILKGVTIGYGSVIGAGAVVTKDIPEFAIAVGNPARVLRYRGEASSEAAATPRDERGEST